MIITDKQKKISYGFSICKSKTIQTNPHIKTDSQTVSTCVLQSSYLTLSIDIRQSVLYKLFY